MNRRQLRPLCIAYSVVSFALFLYSYTQIDLNLAFSSNSTVYRIQRVFQEIGYYQRDVSLAIYVMVLCMLFVLYVYTLQLTKRNMLSVNQLWKLIGVVSVLLVFSYPAFSYDMFNYIFTAKTVLVYHKNPYIVLPQEFGAIEPLVNIMRWIHLPTAYTPVWILTTLPAYFFGFGVLILALWNIKIMIALCYLFAIYCIRKILDIVEPEHTTFGMALFALNPLIIIECLVSGHNDIMMIAVALLGVYTWIKRKQLLSFVLFSISVSIKFMTIFLLPLFIAQYLMNTVFNRKAVYIRIIMLISMMSGFLLVLTRREMLPWYWVWIMPFVSLLPTKPCIYIPAIGISLGLLLRYAPYLYLGHWDPPVPTVKVYVTVIPIVLSVLLLLIYNRKKTHQ